MLTKKAPKKSDSNLNKNAKAPSKATATVENLLKSPLNIKASESSSKNASASKKNQLYTKVIVKCDAGFSNELYIRGDGAGLNWEKGQKLKNVSADEWCWETNQSFSNCHFKILLNDKQYEKGENHELSAGVSFQCKPNFS